MIIYLSVMLLCPNVGLFCCFSCTYDAYVQDYSSQSYVYLNCNEMWLGLYLLPFVLCVMLVIQWLCVPLYSLLFNGKHKTMANGLVGS
jgi:uncharacterized membrane protein